MSKTIRKQLRSFLALSMAILLVLSLVPAVSASTAEPFSATVDFSTYTTETLRAAIAEGENTVTLADNKGTLYFTHDVAMGEETFSIADGMLKVVNQPVQHSEATMSYTWPEALSGKVEIGFTIKAGVSETADGATLTKLNWNPATDNLVNILNENAKSRILNFMYDNDGRLAFTNTNGKTCVADGCTSGNRNGGYVTGMSGTGAGTGSPVNDNLQSKFNKVKTVIDFDTDTAVAYYWDDTSSDWVSAKHLWAGGHALVSNLETAADGTKGITFIFGDMSNYSGATTGYGHYWVGDITVNEIVPLNEWELDFTALTAAQLQGGKATLEDGSSVTLTNDDINTTSTFSLDGTALKVSTGTPKDNKAAMKITWPEMKKADRLQIEFAIRSIQVTNGTEGNFSAKEDQFITIDGSAGTVVTLGRNYKRLTIHDEDISSVVSAKNCCTVENNRGAAVELKQDTLMKFRFELDFKNKIVCGWAYDTTNNAWARMAHYAAPHYHQLEAYFDQKTANDANSLTFNFKNSSLHNTGANDTATFWVDNIKVTALTIPEVSVKAENAKVYLTSDETKTALTELTEGENVTVSALYNNAEGRSPQLANMFVGVYNAQGQLIKVFTTPAATKVTTGYTIFGSALQNGAAKTEQNEVTLSFDVPANASYLRVFSWNSLTAMNPFDADFTLLD